LPRLRPIHPFLTRMDPPHAPSELQSVPLFPAAASTTAAVLPPGPFPLTTCELFAHTRFPSSGALHLPSPPSCLLPPRIASYRPTWNPSLLFRFFPRSTSIWRYGTRRINLGTYPIYFVFLLMFLIETAEGLRSRDCYLIGNRWISRSGFSWTETRSVFPRRSEGRAFSPIDPGSSSGCPMEWATLPLAKLRFCRMLYLRISLMFSWGFSSFFTSGESPPSKALLRIFWMVRTTFEE